jgi:hypothetical protein
VSWYASDMAKPGSGGEQRGLGSPGERRVASSRIDFRFEAWPIVRVEYFGEVTPQIFRESLKLFVDAFERAESEGERIDWLLQLDSLALMRATAGMRKESAEIAKGIMPKMTAVTHAMACVADHAIPRGLVTAITWILPLPWPTQTFATEREAVAWLHKMRRDNRVARSATPGPAFPRSRD